jgi:hypothetical protein
MRQISYLQGLFAALLLPATLSAQLAGGSWSVARQDLGSDADGRAGEAVALCGDVDGDGIGDLVVGMPFASPNGLTWAGSTLVRSGADGSTIHRFDGSIVTGLAGVAVDAGGDVDGDGIGDILVGSPFARINGVANTGRVEVYSGATGALLSTLDGLNPEGKWGISVAFLGDLNGDGRDEYGIGAFQATTSGIYQSGRAVIVDGASTSILYNLQGAVTHAQFGFCVAAAGDVDQDGTPDFMVGAPTDNTPLHHAGKIFLHSGATGALIRELHGSWDSGHMGGRAANAGDVNGDGVPDQIGSAVAASMSGKTKAGAVRVWSGADGALLFQYEGSHADQQLGESLSAAGDLDQDGFADFAVGGPRSNGPAGNLSGAVYLYSGRDGALIRRLDGAAGGDEFGSWLAFGDDLDGDGRGDLLVGVPGEDDASGDEGAVEIHAFDPFLRFGPQRLSAAAGGTIQWDIDFPSSEAGLKYLTMLSRSGTGPVGLGGLQIPLSPDSLFQSTSAGNYPNGFVTPTGFLDANGDGTASFTAPPGFLVPRIGQRFFTAVACYVPGQPGSLCSAPAMVEIVP